jgi:hypothetical protein
MSCCAHQLRLVQYEIGHSDCSMARLKGMSARDMSASNSREGATAAAAAAAAVARLDGVVLIQAAQGTCTC